MQSNYSSLYKNMKRSGESGPGCSAHAQGCDGSTGTQKSSEWISFFFFIIIVQYLIIATNVLI